MFKNKSNIFVFEPVPAYYNSIKNRFKDIPKVSVYDFGLGNKTESVFMGEDGDHCLATGIRPSGAHDFLEERWCRQSPSVNPGNIHCDRKKIQRTTVNILPV